MKQIKKNYAIITTPIGKGGMSVVELFGPSSQEILNKIFYPKNEDALSINNIKYGLIKLKQTIIDEVIVQYIPQNLSFTGEETYEINCHGGVLSAYRIIKLLKKYNAKQLSFRTYLKYAKLKGKIYPFQADMYEVLLTSFSPLASEMLWKQGHKLIPNAVKQIKRTLSKTKRYEIINSLIKNKDIMYKLTYPLNIILVGKENAGKSSIYNAILGYQRAVEAPVAGTTRDFVSEKILINNIPLILTDTAGMGFYSSKLKRKGINNALNIMRKGDLLIFVSESKKEFNSYEKKLIEEIKKLNKTFILVQNKVDIDKVKANYKTYSLLPQNTPIVQTSAKKNIGINELINEIKIKIGVNEIMRFVKNPVPTIFMKKHYNLIKGNKYDWIFGEI